MQKHINRAAVLGSGVMGAAIAALVAGAGISVTLLDIAPAELTEQEEKKGLTLEDRAVGNRFAQAGKDRVANPKARSLFAPEQANLITVGNFRDDMELLREADWILEVVVEKLEVKRTLFEKINAVRKPGSIVSSNTSGISIASIIEGMPLEFRQHFIGTHFFNPPRYMKLVELIPPADCLPEVRGFMKWFMERTLGKSVILCKDTPAFVANRIGTFASVAALQMVEKSGFNMMEIDQITGPVMGRPKTGTFRLMDVVGLDIPVVVAQNLAENTGDPAEKAAFTLPSVHMDLFERGHLGDKTKQGFFKREKAPGGPVTLMWDAEKEDYLPAEGREMPAVQQALAQKSLDEKLKTLVYAEEEDGKVAWEILKSTLLYSARKAEEIAYDYRDIDTAMKCGYNWEYGPFEIWDAIGLEQSVARMREEGEDIPAWVEEKRQKGEAFAGGDTAAPYIDLGRTSFEVVKENSDAVLYHTGDDVLLLKCKTKANSLEAGVSELMLEAVDIAEQGYAGLVLANGGRNFSVGANLSTVSDLAATEKRVESLQRANMALKYCKRPVVAAPFGQTLGGGTEMVLHTHAAVAAAETYMGLVEVGVGLVPAGGGLKELLCRYMEYAARAPGANPVDFVKAAWELAAMGKVSGSAFEAVKWGMLHPADRILLGQEYIVDAARRTVLALAETGFQPPVKKDVKVLGATGRAAIEYVSGNLRKGDFVSEYDAFVADKMAWVITGGDALPGSLVPEEHILQLEKQAFMELLQQEKTRQRIEYMLKTGKRLSN